MKNNFKKFLDLVRENPDLEVIPIVCSGVVEDDYECYEWWYGDWGRCEISECVHTKDGTYTREDYYWEVLAAVFGDEAVADMDDEEEQRQYEALPWKKAIIVYITGRTGGAA